jgi:hypothetical protein
MNMNMNMHQRLRPVDREGGCHFAVKFTVKAEGPGFGSYLKLLDRSAKTQVEVAACDLLRSSLVFSRY